MGGAAGEGGLFAVDGKQGMAKGDQDRIWGSRREFLTEREQCEEAVAVIAAFLEKIPVCPVQAVADLADASTMSDINGR